jgi:phage portal protein BeeE
LGRLWVSGDGLKYEPMTIPAQEAQLIEQLKWTVEDVARCFHVPLYKIRPATADA